MSSHERRLKNVYLNEKFLVDLLNARDGAVITSEKMPKDVRVHTVFPSPMTGCFHVIISSSLFPVVPEGNEIPLVNSEFFVKKPEIKEAS